MKGGTLLRPEGAHGARFRATGLTAWPDEGATPLCCRIFRILGPREMLGLRVDRVTSFNKIHQAGGAMRQFE